MGVKRNESTFTNEIKPALEVLKKADKSITTI